jgi:hypothetical protein
MRYKVVQEDSIYRLEVAVKMFIDIGWEISGSLLLDVTSEDKYLQPMVHNDE